MKPLRQCALSLFRCLPNINKVKKQKKKKTTGKKKREKKSENKRLAQNYGAHRDPPPYPPPPPLSIRVPSRLLLNIHVLFSTEGAQVAH